jgi:BA14K-like protein
MTCTKWMAGAAALALLAATPSASFAFGRGGHAGGGMHMGGGGMHFSGGGGGMRFAGGGARFAAAPHVGGGNWSGGHAAWNGGGWRGGHRGGWIPGAVAGAVVGGAVANSYAYYGGPGYYGPDYYADNTYYDAGPDADVVTVVPGGGDPSYCAQRYRSWDPASQTYLGYDGQRHPCP